ncbi:hypothetical protein OAG51_03470 [Pirellulaceae bacterium]|nr:hypothetical protein [Pirellulaceae bacterium]
MNQRELEKQVADRTGETKSLVSRVGFSLLQENIPFEERQEPLVVDWDQEDRCRYY